LVVCLLGCTTAEDRPPLPLTDAPPLSSAGVAPPPDRWWTSLADAELDRRVDRALDGNFTLAAAWERLQEAEAVVRRARADRAVTVDGTASATVRDGSDVARRTELGLGLEASYEVDAWGRIAAAIDAERRRAAATAADYRAAAITLSSEVALAWYGLVEARRQSDLVRVQLDTNQKVLLVLEERFETGQSGVAADVLRQRQLVEATREQLLVLEAEAAVLEHRLAVLEGRPPQGAAGDPAEGELPRVADLPATGLPADLLDRRPDIIAALRRLEAADADVAAAVRDQYPRIDLAAAIGTSGENPAGLFDDWLASLAAQLVAPLLDGDRRRSEIERTEAVRRRLLAEYGDAALVAFGEVEDALAREAAQVRRIDSLDRQLDLARRTYDQLRGQYLNGAADFIDLLTTLREQQQLERDRLTASVDRIRFRIALHRALAGGFETPRESAARAEAESADAVAARPADVPRREPAPGSPTDV
jgi:NodT family efflux transporter outer membrane factor (OMF) lipoprotein